MAAPATIATTMTSRPPARTAFRSADIFNPLLGLDLFLAVRLSRKLQHDPRLAIGQVSQEHDRPVRKLKRIVMRSQQIAVDLAEYRRLGAGLLDLCSRRAQGCEGNLLGERKLRSRENADRRRWIPGCGKASCAGPEVSRRQLITDLCGARPHMLQAVVAHVEELL